MTELLYRRRWFKWLTSILILFLLFVSFLPYAIRYGIESWYKEQGVDSVSLEDVDINLFTGEIGLTNLKVSRNGQKSLNLDHALLRIDWLPLFKKRSFLPTLEINGLNLFVEQKTDNQLIAGGIAIPGHTPEPEGEKKTPWGFGLHSVNFQNSEIIVKTPEQTSSIAINSITLDKLESWSPENTQINYTGKINSATVMLAGKVSLFSAEPGFEGRLKIDDFNLSHLAIHLKKYARDLQGLLSVNTSLSIKHKPGQWTKIDADSGLQVHNLVLSLLKEDISQDKLEWKGQSSLTLDHTGKTPVYSITGKLNTENLEIKPDTTHLYHHGQLGWQGSITSRPGSDMPGIVGQIQGKDITLNHLPSQQQLFHTNTLLVENVNFNGIESISTGTVKLTDLRTLFKPAPDKKKQNPAMLQAVSLTINNTSVEKPGKVTLDNILFNDALIYIHREKSGDIHHIAALKIRAEQGKETEAKIIGDKKASAPESEQKSDPLTLVISRFGLAGNSRIRVLDESVTPVYKTELLLGKAYISKLDAGHADKPSPFELEAKQDKYSSIKLKGEAYPFSKPISLKLKGDIKNITLPPVSSYTSKVLGYDLTSGQLNADISVNILKGKIDAINKLNISNLAVKPVDTKKAGELTAQINMPLDSALSLLRDKNNDIKLELPIKGDIKNPDFQIGGIINKAIGTAMKKASMSYLKYALQPYGGLIILVQMANKASNAVSLNPLTFKPASADISNDSRQYISKIASLLTERPQLRIKLCGTAVTLDRENLVQNKLSEWKIQQKKLGNIVDGPNAVKPPQIKIADEILIKLALRRADAAKEILVNQHKIDPARLFLCQPSIDNEKGATPRLEIGI